MKPSFKEKVNTYKEEIKQELKNNSIVLSFAIAIIFVGILSCFYNNSNSLLIGIAISALMLTLIQCFSNGNTLLNILPIFTLLIFGFFQKSVESIPVINLLLKPEYTNIIVFISFSLTFLTQSYKNIIFKHKIKEEEINYNEEKNKMINTELTIIKNIKERTKRIKKSAEEANIKDTNINSNIKELLDYVNEETFISNVKSSLIIKGSEDKKTTFNIEEVEESILLNRQINRNREINVNKKEDR